MDYLELVDSMTAEVYRNLLRSVEIGKWPDGNPLTSEQRENAMQAIIAWGELHLPEEERIGYVRPKDEADKQCASPVEAPLKWQQ